MNGDNLGLSVEHSLTTSFEGEMLQKKYTMYETSAMG